MNFINLGANIEEAKELRKLLYDGGIVAAIKKLLLVKHFNTKLDDSSVETRKYCDDDGLTFRLEVTTEANINYTIEFRFFFNNLVPKQCFEAIDTKAGLKNKELSWVELVTLRVLYVIYEQVKFFSIDANAKRICNKKTRVATVWTQTPSGSIGRQGTIN